MGKAKVTSRKIVHKNPYFRVRRDRLTWQDGTSGRYFVVEMRDACATIAFHEDGRILFVEQHRHVADCVRTELPAGSVDKKELPIDCARRELEEETGFRAERLTEIGAFTHSRGCASLCHVFIAEHLTPGTCRRESSEYGMTVRLYWPQEINRFIAHGLITDRVTLAAWAIYCSTHSLNRFSERGAHVG